MNIKHVILITFMSTLITGCVNRGHGLHNFGVVEVGTFYRGAAPESKLAVQTLDRLGIQTVIDLRLDYEVEPKEADWCAQFGIKYIRLPMQSLTPVPQDKLEKFGVMQAFIRRPYYVHCQWGSDRTSVVCACVQHTQGWTNQTILDQAMTYGLLVPAMIEQIKSWK